MVRPELLVSSLTLLFFSNPTCNLQQILLALPSKPTQNLAQVNHHHWPRPASFLTWIIVTASWLVSLLPPCSPFQSSDKRAWVSLEIEVRSPHCPAQNPPGASMWLRVMTTCLQWPVGGAPHHLSDLLFLLPSPCSHHSCTPPSCCSLHLPGPSYLEAQALRACVIGLSCSPPVDLYPTVPLQGGLLRLPCVKCICTPHSLLPALVSP